MAEQGKTNVRSWVPVREREKCGGSRHAAQTKSKRYKAAVCLLFLLMLCFSIYAFTACGRNVEKEDGPLIVCTVCPEYDWLVNILGDAKGECRIKLLLDGSADMHSYQPTAEDLAEIASCDLLIYVGGESDKWLEDAVKGSVNENLKTVKLLDCLENRALEEEIVEGMQQKPLAGGHEHGDGEKEYDEHIWLSVKNAELSVLAISDAVCELMPEKRDMLKANTEDYLKSLKELDDRYAEAVSSGEFDTLLFADRFPFRYMTSDYGIKYYAAFSGCSADAEAGFKTVVFLADRLAEEKLPAVIVLENSDKELAESVIEVSEREGVDILVLDSMQSGTGSEAGNDGSYISVMEDNLEIIKKALGSFEGGAGVVY